MSLDSFILGGVVMWAFMTDKNKKTKKVNSGTKGTFKPTKTDVSSTLVSSSVPATIRLF